MYTMYTIDQIQWPGWRVVRLIGRGSFGTVYEIERDVFGDIERAALKVITIPENPADIEDLRVEGYDDESITTRFQGYLEDIVKEYSTMAKLKGHPNVVYCDDVKYIQHDDGIGWDIYIKMELLTPLVKTLGKTVSEDEVINIGIDMCNALALCKEQNIVHRDIKPQNIFVSKDSVYKLGDFGIAKTAERTTSGTKTGTYKYMAPEVYKSQPYGAAVDQYSLGMVLYWLLNERRTPFLPLPSAVKATTVTMEDAARKRRFDGEQIPSPAHGSKQLQAIVLKACAYDPKQRYSSATEMLNALRALKNGFAPTAAVVPIGAVGAATGVAASGDAAENLTSGTAGRQRDAVAEDGTVGVFDISYSRPAEEEMVGTVHSDYSADQQNLHQARQANSQQGPVFSNTQAPMKNYLTNNASVVIPSQGQRKKRETKRKKRRGIAVWVAVATVLAVAFGGIVFLTRGKNNDTNTSWVDELPSYVTEEDYTIEARTLYSSRKLETTSSTTSNKMAGWDLYDTAEGNGEFGVWSDWSASEVIGNENREVETQARYRYRDKETTSGSKPAMSGWELYDTTYTWDDYGNWSEWSESPVSMSDSCDVETKIQYRYREKSYTTSSSSSLSGWTQYDSSTSYGSWSSWSDTAVSGSSTREVQTQQRQTGTRYYIAHYCTGNTGDSDKYKSGSWQYSDKCSYHELGWFDSLGAFEVDGKQVVYYPNGSVYRCSNTCYYFFIMDTENTYKTQYRYRNVSTTYYFYQWNSWSKYSDSYISSNSDREVSTRTLYRYRDRYSTPTYYFWRWGNWSAWSTMAVSQSNTKEVETAAFYRYRDRVMQPTYFFQRWTEWSEYLESPVEESDTVEVRTKTQYRYRSK